MVNYKSYADRFLKRAYDSLMAVNYPQDSFRLYVADNVTSAESQALVKRLAPQVTIVPTLGNGWGHGQNICAEQAKKDGFADYLFLVNMDTLFDPNFINEAIAAFETDDTIGVVQSKLLLYPPQADGRYLLNSAGNSLTFLGFGFCSGDGTSDTISDEIVDITSAAGAGLLIRGELFAAVGGCDASYFMYHDDIELSQKVRLLGKRLVLAPRSIIYHEHEFNRSIKLVEYMERNRFRFLLEFLKWRTLILMLPAFIFMECGMIVYQVKNRWMLTKLSAYAYFFKPTNLKRLAKKRKMVQNLRTISDAEFMASFGAKVEYQQVANPLLDYIANPIFSAYWAVMKRIIRW